MDKDGGLRSLFRTKLREFQWTSIESPLTGGGTPDNEFCTPTGVQAWIEFKKTTRYYVKMRPLQVGWIMRRCRYGGNAWIAVRRVPQTQQEAGVDELWLMKGDQAEALLRHGLNGVSAWCWSGGESVWNFQEVRHLLCNP